MIFADWTLPLSISDTTRAVSTRSNPLVESSSLVSTMAASTKMRTQNKGPRSSRLLSMMRSRSAPFLLPFGTPGERGFPAAGPPEKSDHTDGTPGQPATPMRITADDLPTTQAFRVFPTLYMGGTHAPSHEYTCAA